ncbi:MAG: hypothetical protein ACXABF_12320 [Candidatus Thorarchaeota archaeon]|jgi:hypothetical protein
MFSVSSVGGLAGAAAGSSAFVIAVPKATLSIEPATPTAVVVGDFTIEIPKTLLGISATALLVNADPNWNDVAILMNYNTDANENLGFFPDAENPTNMSRTTTSPIEGAGSLAAATDGYQEFTPASDLTGVTGYWSPRDSDWTIDIDWFSGTVPLTSDTTDHDLISKYHSSGNDRNFHISVRGDGVSGHELQLVFSDDGGPTGEESGQVSIGTLTNDTDYTFSICKSGDDILVHLDGSYQGKFTLSASFDMVAVLAHLRIGQRSDPAATPDDLDGKFDQFRLTTNVARRTESTAYTVSDEKDAAGHYFQGAIEIPKILDITGTTVGSDGTSHVFNYPATVDVDDLLLLIGAVDGSGDVSSYPSGYAEIGNALSTGSLVRSVVAWKAAAGTEDGGTDTVTWGTSEQGSLQLLRISIPNWNGTTPPEISSSSTANTSSPSFAQLTFGSSGEVYLVIGAGGNDRGDTALSAVPTSGIDWFHSDEQRDGSTTGANAWCAATVAHGVSSITPANFTLSATRRWVSWTIGVKQG